MFGRRLYVIAPALLLAGCAGVDVQALSVDGSTKSGLPGLRYYMPRPYLLVTRLPPDPVQGSNNGADTVNIPPANGTQGTPGTQNGHGTDHTTSNSGRHSGTGSGASSDLPPPPPPAHGAGVAGAGGGNNGANGSADNSSGKGSDDPSSGSKAQAAPAAASDTSYQHTSDGYQIKLVYLPDFSRPMSIRMHSGLLGTASFQPTLVDGWMLTSLQGSGDNKVAETLTAIAQMIASAEGGGKTSSSGGGATKAGAAAPNGNQGAPSSDISQDVLPPGLYGFDYGAADGTLRGLCLVTKFTTSTTGVQIPDCKVDLLTAAKTWLASQADTDVGRHVAPRR